MKRNFNGKKIVTGIVLSLVLTTGVFAKDSTLKEKVDKNADKSVVVDWTDKSLGEVSAPT